MRESSRGPVLAAVLVFATAHTSIAQSLVYAVDTGGLGIMCSATGCLPPAATLVNPSTGHTVAVIPLGPGSFGHPRPTSIQASADGRRLFVTSTSGQFVPLTSGQLAVLDPFAKSIVATVTVGTAPISTAVLPDGSRAYVVNSGDNSVSVVDLSTFTVAATIAVQAAPSKIVASPEGANVYVTNKTSGTVSRISTASNAIAATITVGGGPDGIDISQDGQRVFVANTTGQSVSVIDTTTDTVLSTIAAGSGTQSPTHVAAQSSSRLYVTLLDSAGTNHLVELLDAVSGSVLGSSAIGSPKALARDPSGTPAYVLDANVLGVTGLKQLATDGTSTTPIAQSDWVDAVAVHDPCAFEASASPAFFSVAGGTGTIMIPAPASCPWTVDPSPVTGLTLTSTASGSGAGSVTFSYGPGSTPSRAAINIGRQDLSIERTIPSMNVEIAPDATLQEPITVGGWAFVQTAPTTAAIRPAGAEIDAVHVWAYPASGAAALFVGAATVGIPRPDVARTFGFGISYLDSGFQINLAALPSGTYTLVFYAHNELSGQFDNQQAVAVTVRQMPPLVTVDTPAANALLRNPFTVGGWAIDPAGPAAGPGIDVVHVWAYPASGAPPIFVGWAAEGFSRPDVGAAFGVRFAASGFNVTGTLPAGAYTLVVYARSIATGQFTPKVVPVTVAGSDPHMNVDVPVAGVVGQPFAVSGWALDLGASVGTGVGAIHIWAFPVSGAPATFLGAASFGARPDIAAAFGSQFANAGFGLVGAPLPSGTYDLAVYALSTVTGMFNNVRVIRIIVP